jgi:hypothetical protein
MTAPRFKVRGCPHDTATCPLYLASHTGFGVGCVHGDWQHGCAVDRGADYDRLAAKITPLHMGRMYGFTFRAFVGSSDRALRAIWPWLFPR